MPLAALATLVAFAVALLARLWRSRGELGLEELALTLALHAGLVGLVGTALAWAGLFSAPALAGIFGCASVVIWPWRRAGRAGGARRRDASRWHTLALLALVAAGVGLRSPTIPAPLAGRDQGSYALRAELTARTGALGWTDEVLADAGRDRAEDPDAPGPHDLLGLYPRSGGEWRSGHYEAAYRPGAYLADRDRGEVVTQFFHMHPVLLAVGRATLGPVGSGAALAWLGALYLLLFACCARRLWPRGPWAALALALVVSSPLAIWTARTPLSETSMAVFEWAAVLAALRLRERGGGADAWWAAAMLGFAAFVRGNALLVLPVVLAVLWLRPRKRGETKAAWLVLLALVASVCLHALTAYPYLHDELLRRAPELQLGPLSLILVFGLGALAWWGIDRELGALAPGLRARVLAVAPRLLAVATLAAFVLWWHLRARPEVALLRPPFARLDAAVVLLGWPWLITAGFGVIVVARRWRPRPVEVWLLALAAVVPVTALLYAPRELPKLAFFYYGRYLVPELLPCAALACVALLGCLRERLAGERGGREGDEGRRPDEDGDGEQTSSGSGSGVARSAPGRLRGLLAWGLSVGLGLGVLWSSAGPLIRAPQLRLREYEPADRAVAWLADQLEPGAVLIAGGEGWHHDHTHNQVGGALAMAHGVTVVPYRSREDAWITAWELLVARPARTGEAPPPVYLLVNEAAHQHARRAGVDGLAEGARLALLDDQLWAPFVIEDARLLELFVHALTPVADQLPTRVARHELRMALLRLEVDPAKLGEIERLRFIDGEAGGEVDGAGGARVTVQGGLHDDGGTCLSPTRALRVTLPASASARHLVVVAGGLGPDSQLAAQVPRWRVEVDGQRLAFEAPKGLRARPRASLGPAPLPAIEMPKPLPLPLELADVEPQPTRVIELWSPELGADARAEGDCPYGRLLELRLLGREGGGIDELPPEHLEARTISPADDLGHPLKPAVWVRGRALSRYRPGTRPKPEVRGRSLALAAGEALEFAAVDLPLDERGEPLSLDVVVTLSRTTTEAGARLQVFAGDTPIGALEVPAQRASTWFAEPLRWSPGGDRAALRVVLDAEQGRVELRDIALFTRTRGHLSSVEG
ncbi:hypothetical protein G6O69_00550 [Pseudenhygromyxa sp. WMMC2535]|uniref:hypothetical protein n=1 Tax=Pseudenhygromyxa sp. WMMC2535 TaxID=2712867 RepID=UPI0015520063|nr:hypothetical protein [Pseudenhygromyxa sp. WMMC2535]NVB36300.1 hypothetical protein [Pseudenhygromyxa sp. WMMC2535]